MRCGWLALAALLWACGEDCPSTGVTYREHVKQVFARHCTRCHSSRLEDGEQRGYSSIEVNFDTYEGATATTSFGDYVPERALYNVENEIMPYDRPGSLEEFEICLIERWVDEGVPR